MLENQWQPATRDQEYQKRKPQSGIWRRLIRRLTFSYRSICKIHKPRPNPLAPNCKSPRTSARIPRLLSNEKRITLPSCALLMKRHRRQTAAATTTTTTRQIRSIFWHVKRTAPLPWSTMMPVQTRSGSLASRLSRRALLHFITRRMECISHPPPPCAARRRKMLTRSQKRSSITYYHCATTITRKQWRFCMAPRPCAFLPLGDWTQSCHVL
mmetsp:Transcript_35071/g.84930  ORF Transcript_35071/g.84930 Transcript_35071/m.84930 type:complete len:212 (-) Transcript_35071:410-1045(-)